MFSLATSKYTDLQTKLQIKFKAPRNCMPLLKPRPSAPTSATQVAANGNKKKKNGDATKKKSAKGKKKKKK